MKKILLLVACTATFLLAVDGKTVYETKCSSCHGLNGEVKPLGKKKVIKGMSEQKIVRELNQMKDDSAILYVFKSEKKAMKDQADLLSNEEIKAVAKYIATF